MSIVTVGGLRLEPGSRLFIHIGRIVEVELVEPYAGTTLWIARVVGSDRTMLVETAMP